MTIKETIFLTGEEIGKIMRGEAVEAPITHNVKSGSIFEVRLYREPNDNGINQFGNNGLGMNQGFTPF